MGYHLLHRQDNPVYPILLRAPRSDPEVGIADSAWSSHDKLMGGRMASSLPLCSPKLHITSQKHMHLTIFPPFPNLTGWGKETSEPVDVDSNVIGREVGIPDHQSGASPSSPPPPRVKWVLTPPPPPTDFKSPPVDSPHPADNPCTSLDAAAARIIHDSSCFLCSIQLSWLVTFTPFIPCH